ncbi:helix-turn-helix transcriptional regulator [Pleurocapsales cyanobacterium LEGE 06147]|nr:helix-turn-helix transcriptional regulator [Pleurocapsales cyanobacterium LEGE 06147]
MELDFLRSFGASLESLPPQLQQLIDRDSKQRFHQSLGATPYSMQMVLQQILNCPYCGLTKRMYLESKTLELVVLQFAQWTEDHKKLAHSKSLPFRDVEQIYQARDILNRDLINPPSLMELARQTGLNDYKLKLGFRQVFRTTVFGYVQSCRLELAKQLLSDRNLSIAAIAYRVGYASQSRFCYLFKRQFGMTPKAYRASLHL